MKRKLDNVEVPVMVERTAPLDGADQIGVSVQGTDGRAIFRLSQETIDQIPYLRTLIGSAFAPPEQDFAGNILIDDGVDATAFGVLIEYVELKTVSIPRSLDIQTLNRDAE
jgi:hypothetical protein